jgi:hemin uptake protein HemP
VDVGVDERKRPEAAGSPLAPAGTGSAKSSPVYSTKTLFAGTNEVLIRHEEDIYRLRITRNRKLILTK